MERLLGALQGLTGSQATRPGSTPPQNQNQSTGEANLAKFLAQRAQAAFKQGAGDADDAQPFNLDQRLTASFSSGPLLQTFNSEQNQSNTDYVQYYYGNKNLNPRLPSPWLDGTDDALGSGLNSPTHNQLQEPSSTNGARLVTAGGSGTFGGSSGGGLMDQLPGRHHSFTSGHSIWARPGSLNLGSGLIDQPKSSSNVLQSLSPKGSLFGGLGEVGVGGPHGALDLLLSGGTGGGPPGTSLTPRSSSNSMAQMLDAAGTGVVGSPAARSSPMSQSFTLGTKDPRVGLLGNSFAPGARHRAAPSKLRIGSTVDTVPFSEGELTGSGTPGRSAALQAQGVPEALSLLQSPGLSGAEADSSSLQQQQAQSESALLREAAAVAAPEAQQQLEDQQQKAAMYLQAMGLYGGPVGSYGEPMGMPGNPFTGGPHGAAYPMAMPSYGAAGPPFAGLDAAGMMAVPPGHLDPMAAAGMGLPGIRPGQMPMPFSGLPMPAVSPAEYAAYYQRCMENQLMAAAMGMAAMPAVPLVPGMLMPDAQLGPGMPLGGPGAGMDAMGMGPRGSHRGAYHGEEQQLSQRMLERLQHGGGHQRRNSQRRDAEGLQAAMHSNPVLEEFKANKTRKYDLTDIQGHIYDFALDQHGSRFIQQKLELASEEEMNLVLSEVTPRITHLMTDVFGNYVVQKLLEHGSQAQRVQIADTLKGQVLSLSLQMYGCRVVQKALEVLPADAQCGLVAELDGNVMRCVRDQNGNHVVQKVIERVPTPRITALLDNFMGCVVQLSSHPFGCRIMQRILEHCSDADRRATVMRDILSNVHQLSQDQYGNYVIQHVLEHGNAPDRAAVAQSLLPHVVTLSTHKFASNVVEKALVHCAYTERNMLIKGILGAAIDQEAVATGALPSVQSSGSAGSEGQGTPRQEGPEADPGAGGLQEDALQTMMHDQYGNYVVQKVLEVCDDAQREYLLGRVRAQLHLLKKYTYGKHIVARVEKLLLSGTKIQTHLRARPLPNDTQPLGGLSGSAAAAAAAAGATSTSPDMRSPRIAQGSPPMRSPRLQHTAGSSPQSASESEPGGPADHSLHPSIPAQLVPLPPRASDSASPPPSSPVEAA